MPLVRPVTRHEPTAPTIVQVAPPGDAVTVCDVAGHTSSASTTDTRTNPSPATTVGTAGTLGFAIGVTDADGSDAPEVPPSFVAVAVNVYAVPFVRPDTTHEPDVPTTVHVAPPGDAVTANDDAGHEPDPPATVTLTAPSPATTFGTAGALGINAPDVITRLPSPVVETATNRSLPNTTEFHELSAGVVLAVHVMPSGLVITRSPEPAAETATNRPLPNVTAFEPLLDAGVLAVQVMPSGLVITTRVLDG